MKSRQCVYEAGRVDGPPTVKIELAYLAQNVALLHRDRDVSLAY